MKNFSLALACIFFAACAVRKSNAPVAVNPLQTEADIIKQRFAPDSRTALFTVTANGNILTGETNLPAAKAALLQQLNLSKLLFTDSIKLLPQAELGGKYFGVVVNSVANLRTQPRHPAELATQATMGTPLQVWKKEKGWYLVQTPDRYIAWVDGGAITTMDSLTFNHWQQGEKLLYTSLVGFSYAVPDVQGATVSDMVYGDMMLLKSVHGNFYEVRFADGRTAFIPQTDAQKYEDWAATRNPTTQNLVATSKKLMGLPYLWGGTSIKGVDCSGFTKTVYSMNGLLLPRDASQQAQLGTAVDTTSSWQNLQPGDLLFFGTPAQEGKPEKIVHVGMWLGGNLEFIQAAGRVQINSMNPNAANYDGFEHKRFLRAKHLTPQTVLQDVRNTKVLLQPTF